MVLGDLFVDIFELLIVLTAQGDDALVGNVLRIQLFSVDGDGLEGPLQLSGLGHVQNCRSRCDLA